MERNGLFYGRNMIRFSLKNATKELSPIRLRINLNGERMTFYLPQALGQRGRRCYRG